MRQVFRLPDVGEGLTEAEILQWRVAAGDTVVVNQIVVEIETAKAAVELPSPFAGTVTELLVEPGVLVAVGTPIIAIADGPVEPGTPAEPGTPVGSADPAGAKIGEAGADGRIATLVGYGPRPGTVTRRPRRSPGHPGPSADTGPTAVPGPPADAGSTGDPGPTGDPGTAVASGRAVEPVRREVPLATPPVRKLARERGVDLRAVTGSGPGGVITRADLPSSGAPVDASPEARPPGPAAGPAGSAGTGDRREPIRGLRRSTAAAMVASAFTAPHVTEFLAVDMTAMMELRERLRARPEWADVRLTPLAFAARAACLAARRTPAVNAHWDEAAGEIVYYERVRLGIAAATPRGLLVPTIRDADLLSLRELAAALAELTATARAGATTPAELTGGTFTITNVGVLGVDTGTPILNPGESAILALGSVKPAPWVVDGELAVRTVGQLALSFDHRVVDGEQGSRFLADVGALLTDPALALTW